jgi:DNA mismatch repair ATPase MutL
MLDRDEDTAIIEMKKRAKILYDVKVGETCVELYVDNRFCKFLGVIDPDEEEEKQEPSEKTKSENSDSDSEKSESESDNEKSEKSSNKSDDSTKSKSDESSEDNKNSDDENSDDSEKKSANSDNDERSSESVKRKKKKKPEKKKKEKPVEKEESPKEEKSVSPKLTQEELQVKHMQDYNECRRSLIQSVTDVKKFSSLLNRIYETCQSENTVIAQVFPASHKDVLLELLRRLMEQVVSKVIDNILVQPNISSSDADDLLVYLQNFESIYSTCALFVKEVCSDKEMPISEPTVSIMIENMFAERKQNYINIEVGHYDKIHSAKMNEIIVEEGKVLIEFAQSKHSSGYFSGLFSSSSQSGITANQAQTINALANLSSNYSTNKQLQIPGLKFDVVVTFINENCTALSRCQKLSQPKHL